MIWVRIVLRLSFELEAENCRLTLRDLLHQYFQDLSARSLNQKVLVLLSVFFFFLEHVETRLGSIQPTQI